MRKRLLSSILICAAVAFLLGGLVWLIQLRFATGDGYRPGSTYRTDPLGAKVLHQALAAMPDLTVERNVAPLQELDKIPSDALLVLLKLRPLDMHSLPQEDVIERFVRYGGRLVIALDPSRFGYFRDDEETSDARTEDESEQEGLEDSPDESDKVDKNRGDDEESEESSAALDSPSGEQIEKNFWAGLALGQGELEEQQKVLAHRVAGQPPALPASLPWYSDGILRDFDPAIWAPVYTVDGEVVAIERSYGRGTIIVLTDDYLFTNEAMLKDRSPSFLTWALGDKKRIIFEETHLGVRQATGISALVHRYHLTALFAAFFAFLGVVVWKGASPFLPVLQPRGHGEKVVSEHSIEAGLSGLLRRAIPSSKLPEECLHQWRLSFSRTRTEKAQNAAAVLQAEEVLEDYRNSGNRARRAREIHEQLRQILQNTNRKRL